MHSSKLIIQFVTFHLCLIILALSVPVAATSQPPTPPVILNYESSGPSDFCFEQGELKGELKATTIKYRLIIAPEHLKKPISIFVGFSRKSEPGKLWLLGGILYTPSYTWKLYDPAEMPQAFAYFSGSPIVELDILPTPTDLTPFNRDGELWVGYGLRSSEYGELNLEAFQEMLSAKRYKKIWKVIADEPLGIGRVCINITWIGVSSAAPIL